MLERTTNEKRMLDWKIRKINEIWSNERWNMIYEICINILTKKLFVNIINIFDNIYINVR